MKMNNQTKETRLCGGTLLTVLLSHKRPAVKMPVTVLGLKTCLKQPDFIKGLLRIMRPKHAPYNTETFATQCSNYKNCKINGGSDIPFHDRQYVASFERRIIEEYFRVAEEMNEFLRAYLQADTDTETTAVAKELLGLIRSDEAIPDTEPFYALSNGDAASKSELLGSNSVCISSLLLGILLYVSKYVPENTVGTDTLEAWNTEGIGIALQKLAACIDSPLKAKLEIPVAAEEDAVMKGIPDIDQKYRERFASYLRDLHDDYCKVPSFFQDDPVEFETFYVCPNLTKTSLSGKTNRYIQNPTPEKLLNYARLVAIYGMGGLGKSLLAKHLLMTAIKEFSKTGVVPFFLELKQYNTEYGSFEEYLYKRNESLWDHTPSSLILHLQRNHTLVILDGMDELKENLYDSFERNLEAFIHKYKKAQVVITSRKIEKRILRQFSALDLMLLTLPQAKELISRIGYRKDTDPEFCEAFIEKLDGLYYDYDKYVGNALLLSIMLLTFSETGGILSGKMHRFFEEAYYALSSRHDTVHKTGFRRTFFTGLTPKALKQVIGEFCSCGYNDWNYSFTKEHVSFYLEDMYSYGKLKLEPVDPDAFIEDMKCSLSLMYEEGLGRYSFYHRAFQEYFTAFYIFSLEDKDLYEASQLFEKGHNRIGDAAFSMFYEMYPDRIKKYVFLPLLRDLFKECEAGDGCLTYLTSRYSTISYQEGVVPTAIYNPADSLILTFLLNLAECHEELIDADVPTPVDLSPEDTYYETDDGEGGRIIIEEKQLQWKEDCGPDMLDDCEVEIDEICEGHPVETGRIYLVDTEWLLEKRFERLSDYLTSEESPYGREYKRLKAYYSNLLREHSKPKSKFYRSMA